MNFIHKPLMSGIAICLTNPDNDNIVVFESGKFYSYRTLMNNYYRLKSNGFAPPIELIKIFR